MTLGLVCWIAIALGQSPRPVAERTIDDRTGIPIVFVVEEEMFPFTWRGGDVKGKAESLDTSESERATTLMRSALAAYPKQVLVNDLKKVYVVKKLEFFGLQYGGTNSLDRVYVTERSVPEGYSDAYIVGSFHHEFSSVLLRDHPGLFDAQAWNDANPSGFKYGDGGTNALKTGKASTLYDSKLAATGFLTEYSLASVEEDFNMMAEGLFSGDSEFWKLIDKYPGCKKKLKVMVSFYSKLDPSFTEEFFRARKAAEAF